MTKLKGFKRRTWTTAKGQPRECYYYEQHRGPGGLISLGSDYRAAIRRYADLIGAPIEPDPPSSVAAVYAAYMAWAENRTLSKLSIRTLRDRQGYWQHLKPVFGQCDIDALESPWMLQYFEARSSQVSAKKELKFFQTMSNWARSRGKMRGPDPFAGIMRLMEVDESREIYVLDTWYNLVHACGSPLVKAAMEFSILFATRPAEAEAARFQHIEGAELLIELQKTRRKGLKEKRIPLTGKRLEFINRQKARQPRSFFIVSDTAGQPLRTVGAKFRREWAAARDAAAIKAQEQGISFERFQLRDLRAKAATDIARDHGIEAARLMLGHTTQKQTADYIRSVQGAALAAFGG